MLKQEKLFEQFPPVSTEEWMNRIACDLKGADFNTKLVWKTREGFEVKPFYREEDAGQCPFISTDPGYFPFIRGNKETGNKWLVRQNILVEDYSTSNKKALDVLMKGVDSLGFVLNDADSVTPANIEILLNGIHLESVEINILPNGKAKETLKFLIDAATKHDYDLSKITGAIEADPLGRLMINGSLCTSVDEGFDYIVSLLRDSSSLPHFRILRVNGSNFANAGMDTAMEIAFTISMANEYMSQLTERGISSDDAASKTGFCFGIGSNYFFEIAKLRAARFLWSVVVSAYKAEDRGSFVMNIHSITSRNNKKTDDPYLNLLRTQTEAMSAVLGGTDSLSVEPFDIILRKPDEFSERLARNQQLILKEEAYFDKVADPAGGSYYIEKLTSLIADRAWKLFLEVEEQGGFLEALNKGYFKNAISK